MISSLFYYAAQKISDNSYYLLYGYNLKATKENLEWALKNQKKEDIFKFKFIETFRTYSTLEFAIKCNDLESTRKLIAIAPECSIFYQDETNVSLYFYIDCLDDNTTPNIDLLNFLIYNTCDLKVSEEQWIRNALESALKTMYHFKNIHWEVIEILLEKCSRLTKSLGNGRTPFEILKDSCFHRIQKGLMIRSFEDEKTYLQLLNNYAILQRKYFFSPECSLSFDEFVFHTSNFRKKFGQVVNLLSSSCFISDSLDTLSKNYFEDNFLEEKNSVADEKGITTYNKLVGEFQSNPYLAHKCNEICEIFLNYNEYFQTLVKKRAFIDCVEAWQLQAIIPVLKKYPSEQTNEVLRIIEGSPIKKTLVV